MQYDSIFFKFVHPFVALYLLFYLYNLVLFIQCCFIYTMFCEQLHVFSCLTQFGGGPHRFNFDKFRATAQGDNSFNLVTLPSHMVPSPLYPSLQVQV